MKRTRWRSGCRHAAAPGRSKGAGIPRRPAHAEKALAELDQRQPFVLEVAHDLAGEGLVVSQLGDHEARSRRSECRMPILSVDYQLLEYSRSMIGHSRALPAQIHFTLQSIDGLADGLLVKIACEKLALQDPCPNWHCALDCFLRQDDQKIERTSGRVSGSELSKRARRAALTIRSRGSLQAGSLLAAISPLVAGNCRSGARMVPTRRSSALPSACAEVDVTNSRHSRSSVSRSF